MEWLKIKKKLNISRMGHGFSNNEKIPVKQMKKLCLKNYIFRTYHLAKLNFKLSVQGNIISVISVNGS